MGYKCTHWEKILHLHEADPDWKIDLCIDCSGNINAIQAAIPILQYGATLLIFGVADPTKTMTYASYSENNKSLNHNLLNIL